MKWIKDVDRGSWLQERITGQGGSPAHAAGMDWEAYARILHPAEASGDVDGEFVTSEWSWTEATRRQGLGMHPLVDWNTIGRKGGEVEVDGLSLSPGPEGFLAPRLIKILGAVLERETSTPDDITVGVWTGFGLEFDVWSGASSSRSSRHAIAQETSLADHSGESRPGLAAQAPETHIGLESHDQRSEAPVLTLPHRSYYLLSTTTRDLAYLSSNDEDLVNGLQLIWPADHSWLVASEIDFDSTVVAGSRQLISQILTQSELEVFEVQEGDRFNVDARTVPL